MSFRKGKSKTEEYKKPEKKQVGQIIQDLDKQS
jgi:hypothetical protein